MGADHDDCVDVAVEELPRAIALLVGLFDELRPDPDGFPGTGQKVGIGVCEASSSTGTPLMPSRPTVLHSTVAPSRIVVTIESRQLRGK